MAYDKNIPRPLSEWISGTLTLTFVGGGTHTEKLSQREAVEIREQTVGDRGPDNLSWNSDWIAIYAPVAASTFVADPDCGLTLTSARRKLQKEHGHPDGMLRTLLDDYTGKPEPSFSMSAMSNLSGWAAEVDLDEWRRMVLLVEGEKGARLVKEVLAISAKAGAAAARLDRLESADDQPQAPADDPDDLAGDDAPRAGATDEETGQAPIAADAEDIDDE